MSNNRDELEALCNEVIELCNFYKNHWDIMKDKNDLLEDLFQITQREELKEDIK